MIGDLISQVQGRIPRIELPDLHAHIARRNRVRVTEPGRRRGTSVEIQNEGGERKEKKAKIGKLFSLTWSSVLYFVYQGRVLFFTSFQEVSVLRTSACWGIIRLSPANTSTTIMQTRSIFTTSPFRTDSR